MDNEDDVLNSDAMEALNDLLTSWFRERPAARVKANVGGAYGPLVFAHVAHTYSLAVGVRTLYEQGQTLVAMPLIRQMIESATRAQWIEVYRENLQAVVWDGERQRREALASAARTGQIPNDDPDLASVRDWCDLNADTKGATTGRSFEDLCRELEGGDHVYSFYRLASNLTHPSSILTNSYLHPVEDSTAGFAFQLEPTLAAGRAWLSFAATMLVYAGLCWDRVDGSHHEREVVRKWARRYGLSNEPIGMTGLGFSRWNAAEKARRADRRSTRRQSEVRD